MHNGRSIPRRQEGCEARKRDVGASLIQIKNTARDYPWLRSVTIPPESLGRTTVFLWWYWRALDLGSFVLVPMAPAFYLLGEQTGRGGGASGLCRGQPRHRAAWRYAEIAGGTAGQSAITVGNGIRIGIELFDFIVKVKPKDIATTADVGYIADGSTALP